MKIALAVWLAMQLGAAAAQAQSSRVAGYVPTGEASATGVLMISGDKTVLGGASTVTALSHTAHVRLDRGGAILVCSTSQVHLTTAPREPGVRGDGPLLISLDRGAMEIQMNISGADAVMTPDLRFSAEVKPGKADPLRLSLRVTPNGDTCVENGGRKAPSLEIQDAFGEQTYLLKAGQRVLFEHGSLKEVIDRETDSCGCPPDPGISLAEAAIRGGKDSKTDPYPFPAAVSEGLAPPAPLPAEAPGETHVQVATTLSYDPSSDTKAAAPAVQIPAAPEAITPAPAVPKSAAKHGVFHSIGGFFHSLFVR